MNKYIIEILKVQSSVILPGLGALMVASTRTGKVVFNPHLKFNDGSLAKFIAEKEGVDKQEAENQVAKWIREIEAELGKGNKFEIFEFGHFFTNKDGAVDFQVAGDVKIEVQEKPKATTTQAAPKAEPKKEEPKKEEPKKEEPKKEEKKAAPVAKKEEVKSEPKKEEKPKNTLTPKAEEKKVEEKKATDTKAAIAKKAEETKATADKKVADVKKDATSKIPVAGASASESKQDKNTFIPKKDTKDEPKKEEKPATVIAGAKATAQEDIKNKYKKSNTKTNKKSEKPKKEKKEKGEKKKKSRVGLWILLIILVGGGTAGYFFRNEINEFLHTGVGDETHGDGDAHGDEVAVGDEHSDSEEHSDLAMTENDTTANGEEAMMEESTEESSEEVAEEVVEEVVEEVIEETPVTNTNNSSPGGSYHIIGNAFSDKSNAENYVSTMSGKGYSAQILGRFDNLYLVTIKSFDSRSAANSGLSGVSGDAPGAWVFKYTK